MPTVKVIIGFPNLFEAKKNEKYPKAAPRFSVCGFLAPNDPQIAAVQAEFDAVKNAAYPSGDAGHLAFDTYDNKRVRALTLPCWKLQDSYGHKLNPARWSHFGACVFVIENGEIRKERKWKTEVSQYPQRHWNRRL